MPPPRCHERHIGRLVCPLLLACLAASPTAADAIGSSATRPAPVEERFWRKDPVALRQEIDTFSSLRDGQPAAPGDWELQLESGWLNYHGGRANSVPLTPTVKYTPHRYTDSGYEFFEAMQLSLSMPLEMIRGDYDGSGDMVFGWQERWVAEHDGIPTLATLAEIRAPTGHDSHGTDGTLTGIVAKDVGPGTAYLNAWVRTANGNDQPAGDACFTAPLPGHDPSAFGLCGARGDVRHLQWGGRLGYKLPVARRAALLIDYVHQTSQADGRGNINLLELGAEFRSQHRLSFGPGLLVGLDGRDQTPALAAGFRLIYLFNARQPPAL